MTTSSALAPLLSVSGTNITLQNLTLTGPGPAVVGSVGVKLSGSGHQVLDSKIAGFATGVWADCAWPKDTVGSYGPSCTIGPTNTIGDSTDATGKKLVQIGVHVPSTGQQVTVTQSSITTTADIAAAPDSIADTKRIVLDPGANGDVKALAIVQEPLDKANIWQALSADQTLLSTLLGILPAQGTIDLFKEPINSYEGSGAIFMAHCGAIQKDQNHYPHLALTEGTWLFECKRLNWPYDVGTENIRLSLLYTQGGNSAPYAKAIIRREITPSIPAPLSTIPDTIGGVAPEGPAIGGPGEIVSDGGSGVISSGGLGGGGEVVALGPTGPESSAPAPGPGDTTVPDDKSGTAATASGMTGSATSPVKACSLIRSPAPPLAGSAPSVLGLFLLLTLVVLGTCRIRHPRERSTPS
ncbi:MAG: hypothetical protein HYV03_03615 [Deltaproteobacteria bacterium]|nr:hypothetical protein [Deltaproteobacteria bacterium]